MLDWVRSGLRLGVGGRSFSTRIGSAGVITNQDTNVTSANKFQNWNDLEGKTKKKDERTNGNTKLRYVKKFEIDLLLKIADVLRFMVLTTVLTVSHMIAPMGETIKSFHNN
ncbi:hypothetical protein HZH68_014184 [Vespula germanica]|uniref:Uncharacterized protein n=1 Tax=Vespula germanica TaxID=30212 RepID=A0A834MTA6_VESGE|nr:hypothetical protein HZH68_014184 [Vespula germanica]